MKTTKIAQSIGVVAVWVGLSAIGAPALADVAPPGAAACAGKSAGDTCEGGTCQAQTCSRLDYANWDRDAGHGPPTVSYACVLCVPDGGSGGSGGAGGQSTSAGAGGAHAGAGGHAAGGSSAHDAGGGEPTEDSSASGCGSCATAGRDLGMRSAALSFALFMGLWLSGRGRSRRS
jgi:hypothetical protein